jgi:MYXO-CTERM domain-containing protein
MRQPVWFVVGAVMAVVGLAGAGLGARRRPS